MHRDIESQLELVRAYITQCSAALESLKRPVPPGRVGVGSIVTLEVGEDTAAYLLVPDEGGPLGGCHMLSSNSPIGKEILGKRKGDHVRVTTPGGDTRVKIIDLE